MVNFFIGLSDIYNMSAADKIAVKDRAKGQSMPVTKDTVVFRGKMLFQRGKLLGEGAYAKVLTCYYLEFNWEVCLLLYFIHSIFVN